MSQGDVDYALWDECYMYLNTQHTSIPTGLGQVFMGCIWKITAGKIAMNITCPISIIGCVFVDGIYAVNCSANTSFAFVQNCTFYDQTQYGVTQLGTDNMIVVNNIFALAPGVGAVGIHIGAPGGSISYNDYNCFIESDGTPLTPISTIYVGGEAPVIGPHSIEVDPLFVDAANGNFRLLSGSPCRRTGNPTVGAT